MWHYLQLLYFHHKFLDLSQFLLSIIVVALFIFLVHADFAHQRPLLVFDGTIHKLQCAFQVYGAKVASRCCAISQ